MASLGRIGIGIGVWYLAFFVCTGCGIIYGRVEWLRLLSVSTVSTVIFGTGTSSHDWKWVRVVHVEGEEKREWKADGRWIK